MSTASPSAISTPFLSEELTPPRAQDWKREISHLVESRRERQTSAAQPVADPVVLSRSLTSTQERAARAAQIAATVAARYATAPTYTELWQRQKSSETTSLREVEIQQSAIPEVSANAPLPEDVASSVADVADDICGELPFDAPLTPAITARILLPNLPARSTEMTLQTPATEPEPALEDFLASSWMTPPLPLPANLIEFPRERVAPRRVRPKLAEGPLGSRRAIEADGAQAQLRIFEVDPETTVLPESAFTITPETTPELAPADVSNICASLCLDAQPKSAEQEEADAYEVLPLSLPAASLYRRLMALAVDFCLVSGAFLLFLFVFALSTPHLPAGKSAVAMVSIVYFALWLLYQFLFFSLSHATAGMRYARIALCTFDDENPSRKALRRRIAAWWISALPLGMGFAWALLDEDSLSWHDRMTRTYPRTY